MPRSLYPYCLAQPRGDVKGGALRRRAGPATLRNVGHLHEETTLTTEIIEEVCEWISQGCTVQTAMGVVGIHRRRYYHWLEKAERNPESIYQEFAVSVARAREKAEASLCKTIKRWGDRGDWRAAAWLLAKHNPGQYSDRAEQQAANEVQDQASRRAMLQELTEDELAAVQRVLDGAEKRIGDRDRLAIGDGKAEAPAVHQISVPNV